jgi:hypothetical protein
MSGEILAAAPVAAGHTGSGGAMMIVMLALFAVIALVVIGVSRRRR